MAFKVFWNVALRALEIDELGPVDCNGPLGPIVLSNGKPPRETKKKMPISRKQGLDIKKLLLVVQVKG